MRVEGQLKIAQFELLSGVPALALQGRVITDTADSRTKIYNGTAWRTVVEDGGAASNSIYFTLPSNTTAGLAALTRVAGRLFYDSSTNLVSYDNGSAVIPLATASGQFSFSDGLVGAPPLNFLTAGTTGAYLTTRGMALTRVGTFVVAFGGTDGSYGILARDGSATKPAYSFDSDVGTGFRRIAAGQIEFRSNGVLGFQAGSNQLWGSSAALASAPAFAFTSDVNTGIYSSGADEIGFATNGVQRGNFNNSGIRLISGTVLLPSYSFISDPNTGFANLLANSISVITNGHELVQFQDGLGQQFIEGGVSLGYFKVKVFTGNFSAVPSGGTVATLTSPGTLVLGGMGYFSASAGVWGNMRDNTITLWSNATSNTIVVLNNFGGASTGSYRVVMFYQ